MNRSGLTLLETMVALVILGLVVVGYLELFGATSRLSRSARDWSQAVVYAEDAMELVKIDPASAIRIGHQRFPDGFERRIATARWRPDVLLVSVVVSLPDGGDFALRRLVNVP